MGTRDSRERITSVRTSSKETTTRGHTNSDYTETQQPLVTQEKITDGILKVWRLMPKTRKLPLLLRLLPDLLLSSLPKLVMALYLKVPSWSSSSSVSTAYDSSISLYVHSLLVRA